MIYHVICLFQQTVLRGLLYPYPLGKIYLEFLASLNSFILSLLLVNGPQTLCVNPGCFKCISSINLSPSNKNLFTIEFNLYF